MPNLNNNPIALGSFLVVSQREMSLKSLYIRYIIFSPEMFLIESEDSTADKSITSNCAFKVGGATRVYSGIGNSTVLQKTDLSIFPK